MITANTVSLAKAHQYRLSLAPALARSFTTRRPPLLSAPSTFPPARVTHSRQCNLVRGLKRRPFSATATFGMATDDEYMAFLEKANQDASGGQEATQSSAPAKFKAMDAGSSVPAAIKDVCKEAVYMSEADEPFEEVSLKWSGEGGLPDEEEFAKLIQHWDSKAADITIMDPMDWDSQGQYKNVIEAVRQASKGNDVRVYRVARDKTRVEYWVISREEGRIVGAKALAVET